MWTCPSLTMLFVCIWIMLLRCQGVMHLPTITTVFRSTYSSCMTLPEVIREKLVFLNPRSPLRNICYKKHCTFKQTMWLKTHLFSVMGTKVVIPHADLCRFFPFCVSLSLAMLVEGFSFSKSLRFCFINVSLSVGDPLSTCFICHFWRVWLSKHSTTSCDNMMSSNSYSMFNAFSDLKLLQNVFTNCLISPMSFLLIEFKPSICLT
jgi:hypothetical protein